MTNEEKVMTLKAAMNKLLDAADLLQPFFEDDHIRPAIAELEGTHTGWFTPEGSHALLFDRLLDEVVKLEPEGRFVRTS